MLLFNRTQNESLIHELIHVCLETDFVFSHLFILDYIKYKRSIVHQPVKTLQHFQIPISKTELLRELFVQSIFGCFHLQSAVKLGTYPIYFLVHGSTCMYLYSCIALLCSVNICRPQRCRCTGFASGRSISTRILTMCKPSIHLLRRFSLNSEASVWAACLVVWPQRLLISHQSWRFTPISGHSRHCETITNWWR